MPHPRHPSSPNRLPAAPHPARTSARSALGFASLLLLWANADGAPAVTPIPQRFLQESAQHLSQGLPAGAVQLIETNATGTARVFVDGAWFDWTGQAWSEIAGCRAASPAEFRVLGLDGKPVVLALPWAEVIQVLRNPPNLWVATPKDPYAVADGQARTLGWPSRYRVRQIAASANGALLVASDAGLYSQRPEGWAPVRAVDALGRNWNAGPVLGVGIDANQRVWMATPAGVGVRERETWTFYEGKDGLPYNDFTGLAIGPGREVWFGTRIGAIRFDGQRWDYRQGPRWLGGDHVIQTAADASGHAWLATTNGVTVIRRTPLTLAAKAEFYEDEIQRHIKRTPFGYVAEAPLRRPGDKASAHPGDSDNDGLWTGMYGAGACFAYAATGDPKALARARQAFEALRFLQTVAQGGSHAPPKGYIARTIRPVDWPDPNIGRRDADVRERTGDVLWKVYEPRWPKSADGQWFWKSDTSSDELDGHYFFYAQYFEHCALDEGEKDRVRHVVRGITDHLIDHQFNLVDHDGTPTRWGVYGPDSLNRNPLWWPERGLNSLSILSYLAVAAKVTGDPRYAAASRELIDRHGYAQNAMYPKVQQGPGSGNQSDDEMALMCFYNLLRYSSDEPLKAQLRYALFRYWANEEPELNPFFNFVCASINLDQSAANAFGRFSVRPWDGWLEDSRDALFGFSLDRLNWPHRNSHRIDLQPLPQVRAQDLYQPARKRRGHRTNGKVLPVENRHFNHWNTDPWELDYGGAGTELASGTVFLLPYYMGLFHGYIEKPR